MNTHAGTTNSIKHKDPRITSSIKIGTNEYVGCDPQDLIAAEALPHYTRRPDIFKRQLWQEF
jgi:hypothetical protein